ncbi:hypothetical protein DPMN_071821 [Dreissena polymorpha]|uniref:Uncharacterized protein n=1 Tax=Dreissena polymorpha TaxID=45954 RepID=A0A9D4BWJ3_DREPO|nr:hypothetical protein DPMN_071821 [Dreissena polymorpha]
MAALQAGIDRNNLSVVNEIDAIVCFFPQLDFRMKEKRILTVAIGTRHIVCDATAEKVGIAVIEVSSEYKINLVQVEIISGRLGEMITEAFENILDSLAGFEIMTLQVRVRVSMRVRVRVCTCVCVYFIESDVDRREFVVHLVKVKAQSHYDAGGAPLSKPGSTGMNRVSSGMNRGSIGDDRDEPGKTGDPPGKY